MQNVAVRIRPNQFVEIFKRFSPAKQMAIERRIWAIRMDNIVAKIGTNAKKNKITEKEINKICQQVRQDIYDKRRNRH